MRPVQRVLIGKANAVVGGAGAVLIVDDTGLVKQGKHSVGVARQYCGELGKRANCQALVTLTLARGEVPVPIALRLFLPKSWAEDAERCRRAGVPGSEIRHRPKWKIALAELDFALDDGAVFECPLADAEYGKVADFRRGLDERHLRYAVGVLPQQHVYAADVELRWPEPRARGGRVRTRCPRGRACVPTT